MPNHEFDGHGTTGGKGNADYKEFSVKVQGYTSDQKGLDLLVKEYGVIKVVEIVNGVRSVAAVNGERTKLTAHKGAEKTEKTNAFDELKACETDEERLAIMKKYGMA
mgnify:CR=1 FL=1